MFFLVASALPKPSIGTTRLSNMRFVVCLYSLAARLAVRPPPPCDLRCVCGCCGIAILDGVYGSTADEQVKRERL